MRLYLELFSRDSFAQDFLITFKMVHDNWASKKITHDVARDLAMQSRCLGSDRLVHLITWAEQREQSEHIILKADALRVLLESTLGTFRPSPRIVVWQRQYVACLVELPLRFMSLLLKGESQSGKTRKAISIFGHSRTLGGELPGFGN